MQSRKHCKNNQELHYISYLEDITKINIEILYLWEDDLYKNEELCKKLIQLYIRNKGILLNYNSFNYHLNEDNTMSINSEIIIPYQNRKVNTYKQFVIQNN